MTIIVAIAAALILLYFWLIGHWFARVIAFLLLTALIDLGVAGLGGQIDANFAKLQIVASGVKTQGQPPEHPRDGDQAQTTERRIAALRVEIRTHTVVLGDDDEFARAGRLIIARDNPAGVTKFPTPDADNQLEVARASEATKVPDSSPTYGFPIFVVLGCVLSFVVAWPVTGIPAYYWRYQLTGRIARPPRVA